MDIRGFKERCFNKAGNTKGADNAALAKLIGVSERQLRRYYDVNDPAMPTVMQMGIICETFNVSMDTLMFPERFPGKVSQSGSGHMREAMSAINHHLAVVLIDEDMKVLACTPLFAELYETSAQELQGTNIFKDWAHYAEDNYPWWPDDGGSHRQSVVSTLMAIAKDSGVSSQTVWFISPCGNIKRVLMRCWYLGPNYLFLDAPLDDTTTYVDAREMGVKDGQLALIVGGRHNTSEDTVVLHKWMSGWDIGHIAKHTKQKREQVVEVLDTMGAHFGVGDHDELREALWDYASEDRFWNPYGLVRANGKALV
jgi:hypothetical protein